MVELIPQLLKNGVKYVLTDKFNQDCLEEHFGRQRSKLGGNDNPTLMQYGETELKLQVAKSDSIHVFHGNTSGRQKSKIDITDNTPLPKRRKSSL